MAAHADKSRPGMMLKGSSDSLGANWVGTGVNFALYSDRASAVELCLFANDGTATARYELPECTDGVWHGFLPDCEPGQRYGYRVHGEFAPDKGLYFNPHKLLIDPYVRQLSGPLIWDPCLHAQQTSRPVRGKYQLDEQDSAAFMPKGVIVGPAKTLLRPRPVIAWEDTLLYELNVRGYTMQHPAVAEIDRGRFAGLAVKEVLSYIKALGVTAVELMPCHAFTDEQFLIDKGLRNFWGYNTLNFFAPHTRYLRTGNVSEFAEMANAFHDAGLELILDVVYNHTAEGGRGGPSLSFRGIDNLTYYRTLPQAPGEYINDTGCGNTVNVDHPRVQALVCDSLRYWVQIMGVDGFRFDLASVLGRTAAGFDTNHALLKKINEDAVLRDVKLIAEPWDTGPGGYQLGYFPTGWSELNDKYRDSTRRYWRGDAGQAPAFAHALHGSASIFGPRGRPPSSSINFITSHDGYTLMDLVSYLERHNEANGEDNRDGHRANYSDNFGIEGPTDDAGINSQRRRQRLNMLASVLFSRGTPMLLAGDEFGNSQNGNNNAYAQDNPIGWLDWEGLQRDPQFTGTIIELIRLRRETDLLKVDFYPHGRRHNSAGEPDISWWQPDGKALKGGRWHHQQAISMLLIETRGARKPREQPDAVMLLFNASPHKLPFTLPVLAGSGRWHCAFSSGELTYAQPYLPVLPERSCACFLFRQR